MLFENEDVYIDWTPNVYESYGEIKVMFKTKISNSDLYLNFLQNYVQVIKLIDRRFFIVLDTTSIEVTDNTTQIVQMIQLFCEVNKTLFNNYNKHLLCSRIVIGSPHAKAIINMVISTFYRPHRPLRLDSKESIKDNTFLKKCHLKHVDIFKNTSDAVVIEE